MNILVTGAAGYLGNVLIEKLLSPGFGEPLNVTAIDNLLYKQTNLTEYSHRDDFEFICGDVRDKSLMTKLIAKADVIIPLACIVGMPACAKNPGMTKEVNQDAVEFIVNIASSDQYIVYPTTNSGYGIGTVKEGSLIECTEETPLNPISLYGTTKVNAENAILQSGKGTTLRLATAFGISKRMRLDLLVNDFTYKAVTDKYIVLFESHFKRNFIHVRDIADTFIFAIQNHTKMTGNTYNVGLSDANISKLELCEAIKEQVPDFYIACSEINKDPDQRNYIVSNAKIEALGWKPKFSLGDGIKELIKGYKIIANNNHLFTNL